MESWTSSYHAQARPHDPSCAHQTSKEVPHSGPLGPISGLQLRMRETVGISDLIMQALASSNRRMESCTASYHAQTSPHDLSCAHQTSKEVPHSGPLGPISGLQLRMRETVGISDLIMQALASSNRPHAKRQNHGIMHIILPCLSMPSWSLMCSSDI